MKLLAGALVLATLVACGGTQPNAPAVFCENVAGRGDLAGDLAGSWSLTRNAASATYTFLPDGRFLSHAESDEPGAGPFIEEGTWVRDGNTVTMQWPNVALEYQFVVDESGMWRVLVDGADQEWRRCAVNGDFDPDG